MPMLMQFRRLLLRAPQAAAVALDGKRFIVTGASPDSLGFETACALLFWGAAVTISTRTQPALALAMLRARLPADAAARADALPLDLSDAASVQHFVAAYQQAHGAQLDVLINNAGIHLDLLSQWREPRLSADGQEIHWRTNYLGTMHLTRLLLPLLQRTAARSGEARIVNVVSQLHAKGRNVDLIDGPARYNSWLAYGRSKLALVHASFELQRRYGPSSRVQAYCLHPGAVFTRIADKGLAGHRWLERIRTACRPLEAYFLLNPVEGAQTQLHCATAPQAKGGLYYRRCQPATASQEAADAQVSAQLWDATSAWLSAQQPQSTTQLTA